MNKKTSKRDALLLIIGAIFLIIIGVSSIQSQPEDSTKIIPQKTSSNSQTESTLKFDKENYDFGNIPIYGGKVSTSFLVTNSGNTPIVLTKITTSCMCTEATIANHSFGMHRDPTADITLQPQESKKITVIFDPLVHGDNGVGPITRVVTIETNSSKISTYEIKVTGNVVKL